LPSQIWYSYRPGIRHATAGQTMDQNVGALLQSRVISLWPVIMGIHGGSYVKARTVGISGPDLIFVRSVRRNIGIPSPWAVHVRLHSPSLRRTKCRRDDAADKQSFRYSNSHIPMSIVLAQDPMCISYKLTTIQRHRPEGKLLHARAPDHGSSRHNRLTEGKSTQRHCNCMFRSADLQ
jgi:hypothetical protein